jgi:hypothetical protein
MLFSLAWGLSLSEEEEVGGRGRRAAEAFTFSLLAALFLCVSFFFPFLFFLPSWLLQGFFIKFSWKIMRLLFPAVFFLGTN